MRCREPRRSHLVNQNSFILHEPLMWNHLPSHSRSLLNSKFSLSFQRDILHFLSTLKQFQKDHIFQLTTSLSARTQVVRCEPGAVCLARGKASWAIATAAPMETSAFCPRFKPLKKRRRLGKIQTWNLEKMVQMNLLAKQRHKCREKHGYQGEKEGQDELGDWDCHIYTIHKIDKLMRTSYTAQGTLLSVLW